MQDDEVNEMEQTVENKGPKAFIPIDDAESDDEDEFFNFQDDIIE